MRSEGCIALSQAGVHLLGPDARQVQTPQADIAHGILKHLLLFVLSPENCWFLAFTHCLDFFIPPCPRETRAMVTYCSAGRLQPVLGCHKVFPC